MNNLIKITHKTTTTILDPFGNFGGESLRGGVSSVYWKDSEVRIGYFTSIFVGEVS